MEAKEYVFETQCSQKQDTSQAIVCTALVGRGLAEKILRVAMYIKENDLASVTGLIHAKWIEKGGDRIETEALQQLVIFKDHFVINEITGMGKIGLSTVAINVEQIAQDFELSTNTDIPLIDGDYELAEGGVWIGTKRFSIRIREHSDLSVSADIYQRGKEIDPPECSAVANFEDDGVADDQVGIKTGLGDMPFQWLILPDEETAGYTNWGDCRQGDASELVAKVNADAALNNEHTDWRLPTLYELRTLIGTQAAPKSGRYWSSSPYSGNASARLVVDFGCFYFSPAHRNNKLKVRFVRVAQ